MQYYVKILFKNGKKERLYFSKEEYAVSLVKVWVECLDKGIKGALRSSEFNYGVIVEDVSSMIVYEEDDDDDNDEGVEDLSPWELLERSKK